MTEDHVALLRVEGISYDPDNPRIKKALEKYGDETNAERIHFALRFAAAGNGEDHGDASYSRLKDSILASGGIMTPITVVAKDDGYICIDGNTRLAIYKQFLQEGTAGSWSSIKATVLDNAQQRDIEIIRVSAHLVGSREWPAYEKARYLHYLRHQKFMDVHEMIALCGGNKHEIERQIDAYSDMEEYYRNVVDDAAFHIDRFSGFVELQKQDVQEAIFSAGFTLTNFGEWIRDGKIYRLADVRKLPRVLRDEAAREKFLEDAPRSIEAAISLLERREDSVYKKPSAVTLATASVYQLAENLARRINDLPYSEIKTLKNKENNEAKEQINVLDDACERLQDLLEDVSE